MKLRNAFAAGLVALSLTAVPASATTYGSFGGWGGGSSWGGWGGWGGWGDDCGSIMRLLGHCGGGGGGHGGGGGGGGDPSPVPLPAALPLLAGGLAVAGAIGARRKKTPKS